MIPEYCPLSSRAKLKVVLRGQHDCMGHKEKNDKGIYEKCEACLNCTFHENIFEFDWSNIGGSITTVAPTPTPQVVLPYSTGGGTSGTYTTTVPLPGVWYTYSLGSRYTLSSTLLTNKTNVTSGYTYFTT